jgi:hypothetical protein
MREKARANAEQARTIRAIEAPAAEEPTEAAETVEEAPDSQIPTEEAQAGGEPRERSWWRRIFGGG